MEQTEKPFQKPFQKLFQKPFQKPRTDCERRAPVRHRRVEHGLGGGVVDGRQHVGHVQKIGIELELILVGADVLREGEGVQSVGPRHR